MINIIKTSRIFWSTRVAILVALGLLVLFLIKDRGIFFIERLNSGDSQNQALDEKNASSEIKDTQELEANRRINALLNDIRIKHLTQGGEIEMPDDLRGSDAIITIEFDPETGEKTSQMWTVSYPTNVVSL